MSPRNVIQEQSDVSTMTSLVPAMQAGLLVLLGCAQGAHRPTTRRDAELVLDMYLSAQVDASMRIASGDGGTNWEIVEGLRDDVLVMMSEISRIPAPVLGMVRAQALMREFETAARKAERHWAPGDPEADADQADCDYIRMGIEEILAGTVDWRDLYIREASEAEKWAFVASGWEHAAKEIGPDIRSVHDIRSRFDTLQGEVLAADQRRDEMAAITITLFEALKRVHRNDLPEDLENQVHACLASPRSAETEKLSHALLDAAVQRRYARDLDRVESSAKQAWGMVQDLQERETALLHRAEQIEQLRRDQFRHHSEQRDLLEVKVSSRDTILCILGVVTALGWMTLAGALFF